MYIDAYVYLYTGYIACLVCISLTKHVNKHFKTIIATPVFAKYVRIFSHIFSVIFLTKFECY